MDGYLKRSTDFRVMGKSCYAQIGNVGYPLYFAVSIDAHLIIHLHAVVTEYTWQSNNNTLVVYFAYSRFHMCIRGIAGEIMGWALQIIYIYIYFIRL